MIRRWQRFALTLTLLLLGVGSPRLARAGSEVKVTVHVIHASKKKGKVDPRLKVLEKQLSAFAFRSYQLHSVQTLRLAASKVGEVQLPEGRRLQITSVSRDATGKLKVRLQIEGVVDATYLIDDGGTLIVGGPRHGDGTMILAVTQASSG